MLGVLVGPLCEQSFDQVHADIAVLGGTGVTETGVWNHNALVIAAQRKMIAAAERTIFALDNTKFGRKALRLTAPFGRRITVVTDVFPEPVVEKAIETSGARLMLAPRIRPRGARAARGIDEAVDGRPLPHRPAPRAGTKRAGEVRVGREQVARGAHRLLLGSTEELLQQHGPGEQVRPGRRTEGEQQVRPGAFGLFVAVRRADHEARLANAAVAPGFELLGEGFRGQLFAALVEQDGAKRALRLGNAAAALGQLGQPERPDDPLGIALDQLRLGRTADLPAGEHVEEHGRTLDAGSDRENPPPACGRG